MTFSELVFLFTGMAIAMFFNWLEETFGSRK